MSGSQAKAKIRVGIIGASPKHAPCGWDDIRRQSRAWAVLGTWVLLGGCAIDNPVFGLADSLSRGDTTTSGSDASSTSSTSSTSSASSASSASISSGLEPTSSSDTGVVGTGTSAVTAGSSETTLEPGTTGTSTSSGVATEDTGSQPVEYTEEIVSDLATCVLDPQAKQPYGPPFLCELLVTQELMVGPDDTYGMIVDKAFIDAGGRPAWAVLRFDLGALADAQLLSATLTLTVILSDDEPDSGRIHRATAFDAGTLFTEPPLLDGGGQVDIGLTKFGQAVELTITELVPEPPPQFLYLAIEPLSESPVVYMNGTSDAPPVLKVHYIK